MTDVRVESHGTIWLLVPLSESGREWLRSNVFTEGWEWLGENLGCEPQAAVPLIRAMLDAGLEVA